MWFNRIFLILGWSGVGMMLLDLHIYSPLPGKQLTHIGVGISAVCFVLLGLKLAIFKEKK